MLFSIILGQNGIPVEPGRKAVWEAIWHALRGPECMEMMEALINPDDFFKIVENMARAVLFLYKRIC